MLSWSAETCCSLLPMSSPDGLMVKCLERWREGPGNGSARGGTSKGSVGLGFTTKGLPHEKERMDVSVYYLGELTEEGVPKDVEFFLRRYLFSSTVYIHH